MALKYFLAFLGHKNDLNTDIYYNLIHSGLKLETTHVSIKM